MSYPRAYPTSDGTPLNENDYNALRLILAGYTPSGTFLNPCTFTISEDGTDTYASNAYQTIYGGSSDTGGVDGGDAAAVIQAAVDALGDPGGKILFRQGRYNIDTAIDLSGIYNVWLEMESLGWASPAETAQQQEVGLVQTADIGTDGLFNINNTGSNAFYMITIKNLKFLGDYSGSAWASSAIRGDASGHCNIVDCDIHDFKYGIDGSSFGDNDYIYHNFINRCYRGIWFSGSNSEISYNYISSCDEAGMYIGGENNELVNNQIYSNTGNGITVAQTATFKGTQIRGGEIYLNGGAGILVNNSNKVVIDGVRIYDNTGNGVTLYDAGGAEECQYCIVTNSEIHDNGAYGVEESGNVGVDYNLVHHNSFSGNGTAALIMRNQHSACYNNIGYNPVGLKAAPFDAANGFIEVDGSSATPTASTDYVIKNMDVLIYSSDSGNTDNAIIIDDPNGVQVNQVALSTMDAQYVPRGYIINWGAFTGAAPTCKVVFI